MVRPVPPTPSSTADAENVQNFEANDSGIDDSPLGAAGYSHADDALRRRLGPGFYLRRSGPSPPPGGSLQNEDGAALYRGFLNDEFRRRNLPEPSQLFGRDSLYHRLPEPTSADLIRAGSQLRLLSDEFAQSPMRQWVEDQAARVPLEELDFDAFSELLYGLFQEGGVTWERVVVLFYFCADLAARAIREKLPHQLQNIVEWSFHFFSGERMLRWVLEHGGWVKVMQKSVSQAYKMARIGFLLMGMLAFTAYVWRSR